jgi:polysaccharide biosynthesis protein PslG
MVVLGLAPWAQPSVAAPGPSYYVSVRGSDLNPGTLGAPWTERSDGIEGDPVTNLVLAKSARRATAYRGAQIHLLWGTAGREGQASAVGVRRRRERRRHRGSGGSSSDMIRELNALQHAGANVLRVDVGWASLETAKRRYDAGYLTKLDALVRGAKARRIKVIATLWWTPRWASAGGAWNDAPSNPADYGDFARFITARYGGALAAVEAWNEPEIDNNLVAPDVPLAYAQMLKALYTGAKQGNPGVAVLAGSLSYADLSFLQALYDDGIKGYYDGISMHPYADGAAPENTKVAHSLLGGIEELHLFQLANGDGTPEWVTEFGWPVGTSPGANTEAQQAEYIKKAFRLMDGLSYVAGATVYQLRDMAVDPANPEDNFGLLHANLTPRPAYTAFNTALHSGTP